jgi:hypothetical protein
MKISENTSVSMPIRNMVMIIAAVAMGVFAYTEVTARLTSLETSRELFENDLLKKSEQVPTDQEQHFLLEDLYKTVEKLQSTQEMNMTNKVNIEFLNKQLEKALNDIEHLKDKVRKNGNEIINGINCSFTLIINGEIKEHRIQQSMSDCLKGKRVAMRLNKNNNIQYQCIKSMAELESNIDGSKSIKKLILE